MDGLDAPFPAMSSDSGHPDMAAIPAHLEAPPDACPITREDCPRDLDCAGCPTFTREYPSAHWYCGSCLTERAVRALPHWDFTDRRCTACGRKASPLTSVLAQ